MPAHKGPRLGGSSSHQKAILANWPRRCSSTAEQATRAQGAGVRPIGEADHPAKRARCTPA